MDVKFETVRIFWVATLVAILIGIPFLCLSYEAAFAVQGQSNIFYSLSAILGTREDPKLSIGQSRVKEDLEDVFAMAATATKTVILTTLNEAWAANNTMIDLYLQCFLQGEKIEHLLDHMVIVTLDQSAHERCLQLHPHCFRLNTSGVDFTGEKKFMSEDYLEMMWTRIKFLREVLELGYSFIFSDADIMWFRDPFARFFNSMDFQIACDNYCGKPFDARKNSPNGGFLYVRSNERTIAMYSTQQMSYVYFLQCRNKYSVVG